VIVVDSSALIAWFFDEPEAPGIVTALQACDRPEMSVANYVEAGTVLAARTTPPMQALATLDDMLATIGIHLVAVDDVQARLALQARIRYGRGFGHPARLNYGDSFAYALAKTRNAPLLFIGNEFAHTDIASALT
jgi:ribonuclease VapC